MSQQVHVYSCSKQERYRVQNWRLWASPQCSVLVVVASSSLSSRHLLSYTETKNNKTHIHKLDVHSSHPSLQPLTGSSVRLAPGHGSWSYLSCHRQKSRNVISSLLQEHKSDKSHHGHYHTAFKLTQSIHRTADALATKKAFLQEDILLQINCSRLVMFYKQTFMMIIISTKHT